MLPAFIFAIFTLLALPGTSASPLKAHLNLHTQGVVGFHFRQADNQEESDNGMVLTKNVEHNDPTAYLALPHFRAKTVQLRDDTVPRSMSYAPPSQ